MRYKSVLQLWQMWSPVGLVTNPGGFWWQMLAFAGAVISGLPQQGAKVKAAMKIPQHDIRANNQSHDPPGDMCSRFWILPPDEFRHKMLLHKLQGTMTRMVCWRSTSGLERRVNHDRNPSPNDNRRDGEQVTKRLSDGDKKEIACSASSRLTLPRYLACSLIRSCGQFLVLSPLFAALFLIALPCPFFY